jgi:hypothetical protein
MAIAKRQSQSKIPFTFSLGSANHLQFVWAYPRVSAVNSSFSIILDIEPEHCEE